MENENVQTAVAENEEQKQVNIFENFNLFIHSSMLISPSVR